MRYVIRERFFRLGEDNDILTDTGQPAFQVDGKALSLRNLMVVSDVAGNQVAQVTRKLAALLATYEIALTGGGGAEVQHRFSNPLHPRWTIAVAGGDDMEMTGNFTQHAFTITHNDAPVATVSKAWISMTDAYGVDIVDGQNNALILCCVLALEAEQDRQQRNR